MKILKNKESSTKNRMSNYLLYMPVLLFIALAISIQLTKFGDTIIYDPPILLPFLNLLFLFFCPMFVGYLASKGYLKSGTVSLITMGSGVFALALGSLIAGFLLPAKGPNAVITIHNISACLSGILHVAGAILIIIGYLPEDDIKIKKYRLIKIYLGIFVFLMFLTFAVLKNILPTFFIQGQGPTLLRQMILGTAVLSFFISGILFFILNLQPQSRFLNWYTAALFLFAIGLVCVFIQKSFGGPIGWLGRITQYTGGLYLVSALIVGSKEGGVKITQFDKTLAKFFRNRFEALLMERTAELEKEITERKKVEVSLKKSEQKYKILIENLPQKINFRDRNSVFVTCNRNFADELKILPDEIIGKTDYDFYPNKLAKKYRIDDQRIMQSGGTEDIIEEHLQAGKKIIVQTLKTAVFDDKGVVIGLLCIYWDITERIHAEEQIKTSLKEKETLLQEIHHRVKNNMAVISSLLKLQANNIEDQTIKDIFEESQGRIFAMSAVHETLHDSEKLSEIDLKTYLTKITTTIFQTYSVNHGRVKLNSDIEDIPISINQASPLGLIINELVSNALKYGFPNEMEGEIDVTLKQLNKILELTIIDNGIGISDDFDWKNTKTLGLKLVKKLVENQLDGSIDMESYQGTKFTIIFNIET